VSAKISEIRKEKKKEIIAKASTKSVMQKERERGEI
jgi:hypothetical protein